MPAETGSGGNTWLDRVETQARIFSGEPHRGSQDALLRRGICIDTRDFGAASPPLTFSAGLDRNELASAHPHDLGGPAIRVFNRRAYVNKVGSIRQMRRQRVGQGKRPEVVGRKRHVEAVDAFGRLWPHDAGIVEHAGDPMWEGQYLLRRAPDTGQIGHVAHDRNCPAPLASDGSPDIVELSGIAADQNDRAVSRQVQRCCMADAGGRTGDDIGCIQDALLTCLSSQSFIRRGNHAIIRQSASNPALQCFSAFGGSFIMKSMVASAVAFMSAETKARLASRMGPRALTCSMSSAIPAID